MVIGILGGEYMDIRVIRDEFSILDVHIFDKCNKNVVVMTLRVILQEVCAQTPSSRWIFLAVSAKWPSFCRLIIPLSFTKWSLNDSSE
jgi:hypothetical protein